MKDANPKLLKAAIEEQAEGENETAKPAAPKFTSTDQLRQTFAKKYGKKKGKTSAASAENKTAGTDPEMKAAVAEDYDSLKAKE